MSTVEAGQALEMRLYPGIKQSSWASASNVYTLEDRINTLTIQMEPKWPISSRLSPDELSEIEAQDVKESIAELKAGKAREFSDVDELFKWLDEEP